MRSRYRRSTRRYGRPTRRYRRTTGRTTRVVRRRPRPRMTRRSILNTVSQKKSDTMAPASNVTVAGVITIAPILINSSAAPIGILFSPTQRIQSSPGLTNNQSFNPSAIRSSQRIYAKGFTEIIRLIWDNGTSWTWRRIVFSCKSDPALIFPSGAISTTSSVAQITGGGIPQTARVVLAQGTTDFQTTSNVVFKGRVNEDTNDACTAPLDRERIRVHYDRTSVLNCPSGSPTSRRVKMYIPLNKSIYYNDDERGVGEGQTSYTASGSSPLGDVYIWDIFESATNPGTAAVLNFNPECRFYWHER